MAYVDQQVYLFQDSLRFNITLGADYSDEDMGENGVYKKERAQEILNEIKNISKK